MDSLSFRPGRAFLPSNSTTVPWTVVFEDEGVAGYFYACDRSRETQEESILDAMLIYNVDAARRATGNSDAAKKAAGDGELIASVQWSKDGLLAALYIDGSAQAIFDFGLRCGYCKTNFPNFLDDQGSGWRKDSHAWNEELLARFEAEIYA
ncbi:MAG TPA: DUF2251 domain-containing protein [Acidobacteriaceae bacterium]|nr:DUF2251 domain-containing protein [Acidobacteriaceae bacterium]